MNNIIRILKLTNQFEYHLYAFASKKDLIEKFPEYQEDLNRLNAKYIKWLDLRFGDNSAIQEVHPIGDCISTLLKFQSKDAGISQKYTHNPEFKNQIDEEYPLDKRRWSNPSDLMSMTIDEMERILVLYSRPKSKHTVEGLLENPKDNSYTLPTEDLVAKVGSWNIWLPSSRENSCKIAGYDPVTLKPFTTWCTARTEGSNLFYNYVSGYTMLFYIIKDNPTSDDDWLSVGFINGKPILEGDFGGISVNRANKGLFPESLNSILGGNYETIMKIMQSKNNSLNNKSPAQIKIEEAATDINKFKSLIRGNTEEEARNLKLKILQITKNKEILAVLANDGNKNVRYSVAQNPNTSQETLAILANDSDINIRYYVARNPNTNSEILAILATDSEETIRGSVPKNPNANPEILAILSKDSDKNVRYSVAKNPNTNPEILAILANDSDRDVKEAVAQNPNTNQEALAILATDNSEYIKSDVAQHPNTSQETLAILATDSDKFVRSRVARHPNTNEKTLELLAKDRNKTVAEHAIKSLQERRSTQASKILQACEQFTSLVKEAEEQISFEYALEYGDPGYWEHANDDSIRYDFDEWVNGYITITYSDLFKFFDRLGIEYKPCGKSLQPAWGLSFEDDKKYVLTFGDKVSNIESLKSSDKECDSPTEAKDFIDNADESDLDKYVGESEASKDFWEFPGVLYHATDSRNKEEILENGLIGSSDSRGLTNRSVGSAVFTSTNPDVIEAYGDLIFEIDTAAMKAHGYTPEVGVEPDIAEGERKQSLAHMVGLEEYSYDFEGGMDTDTYIVYGNIPPEYLKIHRE